MSATFDMRKYAARYKSYAHQDYRYARDAVRVTLFDDVASRRCDEVRDVI